MNSLCEFYIVVENHTRSTLLLGVLTTFERRLLSSRYISLSPIQISVHSFRWLETPSTLWWSRSENEKASLSPPLFLSLFPSLPPVSLPLPLPLFFSYETRYSYYIKGKSRKSGSIPPLFLFYTKCSGLKCLVVSRVCPPVSPCAPFPTSSCLASVSVWVCLSPCPSSGRGVCLCSHVCLLFLCGGMVARGDRRVYLFLKDKRAKSQRHLLPVR